MKKQFFSALALTTLLFVSCSKDDDPIVTAPEVVMPSTYEFTRDGKSTVDYSGQKTRLDMHSQLKAAVAGTTNTPVTLEKLNKMFNHVANDTDFTDGLFYGAAALNASSKNISGATAYSKSYKEDVKTQFNTWFSAVATASTAPELAEKGKSGYIDRKEDGSKRILIDAKGFEYTQLVSKSLMGAMQLDQIVNKYLSPEKLAVENDVNKEGKDYTAMEHHWDEAFGYATLTPTALTDTKDKVKADHPAYARFLGAYIYSVDGTEAGKGIKDRIMKAFLTGRQAIAVKNYTVRDAQATILKQELSKAIAIKAVNYLKAGKANVLATASTDKANAYHAISEGYGFIYALQFSNDGTGNPYFTKEEVTSMLSSLEQKDGLYNTDIETTLQELSDKIAKRFAFSVDQA